MIHQTVSLGKYRKRRNCARAQAISLVLSRLNYQASFPQSLLWRPIPTTKMADVYVESYGHVRNNVLSGTPSPLPRPYLPSLPPAKTTKPSYSR